MCSQGGELTPIIVKATVHGPPTVSHASCWACSGPSHGPFRFYSPFYRPGDRMQCDLPQAMWPEGRSQDLSPAQSHLEVLSNPIQASQEFRDGGRSGFFPPFPACLPSFGKCRHQLPSCWARCLRAILIHWLPPFSRGRSLNAP